MVRRYLRVTITLLALTAELTVANASNVPVAVGSAKAAVCCVFVPPAWSLPSRVNEPVQDACRVWRSEPLPA